jgi:hypothetical protein
VSLQAAASQDAQIIWEYFQAFGQPAVKKCTKDKVLQQSQSAGGSSEMFTPNPDEIVIYGATADGKPFRPSDWAERLCGLLSSFGKEHRLCYHEWVRPLLIGKVRSVTVGKRLATINPPMFQFLMDFAATNGLQVLDEAGLKELLGDEINSTAT